MTTEIPQLPEKYRELKTLIDGVINAETSTEKYNWSVEKPFIGQGAAIALMVQAKLGGEIVTVDTYEGSNWRSKSAYHYNVVDGEELHFCPENLPENVTLQKPRRDPDRLDSGFTNISSANALIERYNKQANDTVARVKPYEPPRPKWMDEGSPSSESSWIPITHGPQ